MITALGLVHETQASPLPYHHVTGERQTDAAARALGGEEWHEDALTGFGRDGLAVIADENQGYRSLILYADMLSTCLNGVLHEVDEYLAQHVGIGIDYGIVSHSALPTEVWI